MKTACNHTVFDECATQLIRLGFPPLEENLSLYRYKEYMSHPLWSFIQQMITSTRSYHDGLEAGFFLLKYTEQHRKQLSKEGFEENVIQLTYFILKMLDKLDMWEEYLYTWDTFMQTRFRPSIYSLDALPCPW